MSTRRSYMCMSVEGALRDALRQPPRKLSYATGDDGRTLTFREFADELIAELRKGHDVIPTQPGCGNPCARVHLGCTGFVYASKDDEQHGCPGYSVPDKEPQS